MTKRPARVHNQRSVSDPSLAADLARPLVDSDEEKRRRSARIGWFVLGILPTIVIALAATLTPDPSGHGTHTQLGLPPGGFLVLTGYPCPGCGLTTSFAHMTRLQFIGATHANPFGVILFLVSFFTIPVAVRGFWKGSPVLDTLDDLHFEKWAILLCASSIGVWLVRIATQYFHL